MNMLRFWNRGGGRKVSPVIFGFFGFASKQDIPSGTPTAEVWKQEIQTEAQLTGWDRLKEMWRLGEHGPSVELTSCVQLSLVGALAGFIIGGIDRAKFATAEFKERNQATVYKDAFVAQRAVHDYTTKQFVKGALPMSIKTGSFIFCYSLLCTSISCYRNRTSISDFSLGGLLTGSLFTVHRGLAGMVSGGTLGLLLGSVTGVVLVGVLHLSGVDLQEVRMWQYDQVRKRKMLEHRAYVTQRARESTGDIAETAAVLAMKEEEKKTGRIVDKLQEIDTSAKVDVVVPALPPESFLKDRK